MAPALLALSLASLLVWAGLLLARDGFWRADQRLGRPPAPRTWPSVTAVVPARNEAATIAATANSVLRQAYSGKLRLIIVDDASEDGTAAEAARGAEEAGMAERLEIVSAPPLPAGWSGKLWALETGVSTAAGEAPDFYWFTDADIVHGPEVLARLVAKAEDEARDLVSLMVRLRTTSFWERALIPAFVFFFQMLYPFPAVNDPLRRTAGAAGGCMLARREIFERTGAFAAIKDALIDDCTLAARIRDAGGRLWLGLAEESRSLRAWEGLAPLWRMVKRTAFVQLGYSPPLLLGTIAGLAIVYLFPPLGLAPAIVIGAWPAAACALGAWLAMVAAYAPTLRYYGRPAADAFALPAIAALYAAMTIHAAIDHWRGRGSAWKGRAYGAGADGRPPGKA